MRIAGSGAWVGLLAAFAAAGIGRPSRGIADDRSVSPSTRTSAEAQLASDCDDLLALAVHRPYGIGWPREAVGTDASGGRQVPVVSFSPSDTPAAGLMLWWAGKVLHESRYANAAVNAARAIAMSQGATGKIPGEAPFGAGADRGREAVVLIPDRDSTRAALGLVLTILAESGEKNEQLRSCALRGAAWLRGQQAGGGWPTAYPPGEIPERADRVYRLDTPDWRDCTLALLLAADVMSDKPSSRTAAKARQTLLALRLRDENVGDGDWSALYALDHAPRKDVAALPYGLDTTATQYAMQSLLADAICTGDAEPVQALEQAAASLKAIRRPDGSWKNRYPSWNAPVASSQPATVGSGRRPPAGIQAPTGLNEVVLMVQEIDQSGLPALRKREAEGTGVRRDIALVLCGLSDDPFAKHLPDQPPKQDAVVYRGKSASPSEHADGAEVSSRARHLYRELCEIEARVNNR